MYDGGERQTLLGNQMKGKMISYRNNYGESSEELLLGLRYEKWIEFKHVKMKMEMAKDSTYLVESVAKEGREANKGNYLVSWLEHGEQGA